MVCQCLLQLLLHTWMATQQKGGAGAACGMGESSPVGTSLWAVLTPPVWAPPAFSS